MREVAVAIAVGSGLIALAIFARPTPERYRFDTIDKIMVRYDTVGGGVDACSAVECGHSDFKTKLPYVRQPENTAK